MVDTVRCVSLSDITPCFLEKLLIGSLKRGIDKTTLPSHSCTGAAFSPMPSSPATPSPLASSTRSSPISPRQDAGLGLSVRMSMDRTSANPAHSPTSDNSPEAHPPTRRSQRFRRDFSPSPRGSPIATYHSNLSSPVSPAQEQRSETRSPSRPSTLASPKKKFSFNIFR